MESFSDHSPQPGDRPPPPDTAQPPAPAPEQADAAASDKRRFQRVSRTLPLQYQLSHGGQWVQGQGHMEAVDIGAGGLRIRLSHELGQDSALYLHVPLEDGAIYAMARVVWAQRDADGDYTAGIAFVDLPVADQERLAQAAEG